MDLTEQEMRNKEAFSHKEALEQYSQSYLFPVEERIFNGHFAEPGTVLDIGCGCGRTSLFLKRMGHTVTGIDIVPEMIETARNLVEGIDFRIMDACELMFDDESFDYVLFSFNGIDCIYPVSKRTLCLREIHRVLKPMRPLAFSAHNAASLRSLFPTNRFRVVNWMLNVKKGRLFGRYRLEKHPSGVLELYVTTPFRQKRELERIGFRQVEVYGQSSDHPIFTHFLDTWSYYVCRK
jgi:ubiquinone/menaquinone biosynthesis C-methylase UbiE